MILEYRFPLLLSYCCGGGGRDRLPVICTDRMIRIIIQLRQVTLVRYVEMCFFVTRLSTCGHLPSNSGLESMVNKRLKSCGSQILWYIQSQGKL